MKLKASGVFIFASEFFIPLGGESADLSQNEIGEKSRMIGRSMGHEENASFWAGNDVDKK